MTDAKPKYANFPERDLKVAIGAHINASTAKALTRLTIGTYEMSFTQIEKGKVTCESVRLALNQFGKANNLALSTETSREYVGVYAAASPEVKYQIWVTTPFELTQANHLIWVRFQNLAEGTNGVAFRLSNAFSPEQILDLLKAAQKNAIAVPSGEAYTLVGNPPPRFQKKGAAAEPAAEAPAEAAEVPAAAPEA